MNYDSRYNITDIKLARHVQNVLSFVKKSFNVMSALDSVVASLNCSSKAMYVNCVSNYSQRNDRLKNTIYLE